MTVAVRALVIAVAALAGLWFVQGLGPVRDQKAGLAAVTAKDGRTPQERAARGSRLLEAAAAHTRSTAPEVNLAQLDVFTKQPAKALPRLRSDFEREIESGSAVRVIRNPEAATMRAGDGLANGEPHAEP